MKKLDKKYNFAENEKKWQKYWQDNGIFKFDWNDTKRENIYSIDTPPPHVSGSLHMGHIFSYTQMDIVARFQRMMGKNVFYPIGFDDNGLPSERYVEKKIGKKSKSMDRQEFVKICDKEIQDAEQFMKENFIKISHSYDFNLTYRTISPIARKVSQMSFLDLYKKGKLYRKEEPIIWDVVDQTALAQTEAEDKEIESQMNYIEFDLVGGNCGVASSHSSLNLNKEKKPLTSTSSLDKNGKLLISPLPLRERGQGRGVVSSRNYSQETLDKAKELRQSNNLPEDILWEFLRNKQLEDLKFRRQHPIDKYVVDFVCLDKKVIVEIDGKVHEVFDDVKEKDNIRQKNLERLGYRVIRFNAKDVVEDTFRVLDEIVEFVNETPNPCTPSPQGGRGGCVSSMSFHQGGRGENEILSNQGRREKSHISSKLTIMTTRPELLPACVAIFAHPDDRAKYEGKSAITPLGIEVPILFDESVEKDKGTGVMMCCTFGDGADVEKYKKYNLPLKMIINEKGCLYFDNVPEIAEKYKSRLDGLFTAKAREEILNILQEEGKIVKEPEKIIHNVKIGERSKSPLEILVKNQWNIDVLSIKDELHKKASEIKWHPEWMENRIHTWIDGLSWNWTISRQRFFGVPVPCWYSKRKGEEGKVILPNADELPIDPTVDLPKGYTRDEVVGETDVFDTWMTSSVSPQLSTQCINDDFCCDKDRAKVINIPFDLRPQAHDIIRTWAFCTITKSFYHENKIPWKNIFISGYCLASDGTKMSKSKGNGVDPIKTLNEFGADSVRYWAGKATLGNDTPYSVDVIKNGQKLITKLFNSAKFAEMMFENLNIGATTAKADLSDNLIFETIDKWMISRAKKTIESATGEFKKYNYNAALDIIENMFWNDFCDNYLEIVKGRAYGLNFLTYSGIDISTISQEEQNRIVKAQQSAIRTIYYVFNAILKLFAPFVPSITDEIYSCLYEDEFNKMGSISARGNWAKADDFIEDREAEEIGRITTDIIAEVRKYKSEKNISIKSIIDKIDVYTNAAEKMDNIIGDLKNVCNVQKISFIKSENFSVVF